MLLSNGEINKKKILELALKGNEIAKPEDIVKDPSIGLILCIDKGNVDMQYALGGLSNNIFASKYVTYMPDKKPLKILFYRILQLPKRKCCHEQVRYFFLLL